MSHVEMNRHVHHVHSLWLTCECVLQIHSHHFTCKKGALGRLMCRLARAQMTCSETHMVEFDQTHLPPTTNAFKLHSDPNMKYEPRILASGVSKPLKADRQDLKLPFAARSCSALNVDRRVVYLNIKRPALPDVHGLRDTVEAHCRTHAVIPDEVVFHCASSSNETPRYGKNLAETMPDLVTIFKGRSHMCDDGRIEFTNDDWQQLDIALQVTDFVQFDSHLYTPNVTFAEFQGTLDQVIDQVTQKVQQLIIHRNGMVVETNDVLSACTQSQSNVQTLSTAINSKNSLKYMTAYLSKQKASPTTTFALLASVRKDVLSPLRKSREDDSGSISRTAKHFLARVNNMFMKKQEISASQTAQVLLQVPVFFTSQTFRKLMFNSMHDSVVSKRAQNTYYANLDGRTWLPFRKQPAQEACSDDNNGDMTDNSSSDEPREDPHDSNDKVNKPTGMNTTAQGFGVCPTYSKEPVIENLDDTGLTFKVETPNIAVPQHVNIGHRGEALKILNALEYVSLVDDTQSRRGQKSAVDNDGKDVVHMPDLQQKPTGLKWQNVGDMCPDGTELEVLALKQALQGVQSVKTFTPSRWSKFKIENLEWNHYVTSNGRYFKPLREGRKPSPSFEFGPAHPLRVQGYSNVQKLFSLQHTPLIVGPSPPSLPNVAKAKEGGEANVDSTKVKKKLDYLGKYYLLLFCPWSDPECGPDYPLTFAGFTTFVNTLAASTCPWDQGRLAQLQCILDCQNLDARVRTMLATYRNLHTTRWNETNSNVPDRHQHHDDEQFQGTADAAFNYEAGENASADEFDKLIEETLVNTEDISKLQDSVIKQYSFLHNRRAWLTNLHEQALSAQPTSLRETSHRDAPLVYKLPARSRKPRTSIQETCKDVIDQLIRTDNNIDPYKAHCKDPVTADDVTMSDSHGAYHGSDDTVHDTLSDKGLYPPNAEQQLAIDTIMRSVRAHEELFSQSAKVTSKECQGLPKQLYLLHGAAGTGKTNVIKNVQKLCRVVCVATTGVAASLMCGATTYHSRHKFLWGSDKKNVFPPYWSKQADNKSLLESDVYFLDEVSMLNATTLGLIDAHLRHVRSQDPTHGATFQDMPFGGITVVLCGDFIQIPPVLADALYVDVWKEMNVASESQIVAKDTPKKRGTSLMQTFVRLELKEQQRLRAEPHTTEPGVNSDYSNRHRTHANMLNRFRTHVNPLDDDEIIAYLNKRQLPETADNVTDMNNMQDPDWRFATWIVTNNQERYDINFNQAKEFAKERKTPLLWWQCDDKQGGLKDLSVSNQNHIFESTPGLKDMFVADAPVFLTTQISPPKGLANGTRATLHSLIFTNPYKQTHALYEEYEKRKRHTLQDIEAAQHTEATVRLRIRPSYVVVRVDPQDGDAWMYDTLPRRQTDNKVHGGLIPLRVNKEGAAMSHSSVKENDTGGDEMRGNKQSEDKTILIPSFRCQDDPHKVHPPRRIAPEPSVGYQLGFAMTAHKCQGCTMGKVIIDLSSGPFKKWDLMMMYVALTRVRDSDDFRLVPFQERQEDWSRRLRKYKMPTALLSFLHAFDTDGNFDIKRMQQWFDTNSSSAQHKPKESPTKGKNVKDRATTARLLRIIPDPFQNVSFVNAIFYSLYPVYESHILQWGAHRAAGAFQENFDTIMSACLTGRTSGEKRNIAQSIQNQVYGNTSWNENNVYSNIASILPSFGHHFPNTPTPHPADFMTALALNLGWNGSTDSKCTDCGKYRSEKLPAMAMLTISPDQFSYSNGCNVQQFLNDCTQCQSCRGLCTHDVEGPNVWGEVDVLCVNIPHLSQKDCQTTLQPMELSVIVNDITFDLVSFTFQRVDKQKKRSVFFNKVHPYTASVRMPPWNNDSVWHHDISNPATTTTSFSELTADAHMLSNMSTLLYIRKGSGEKVRSRARDIVVGDLLMHKGFIAAITSKTHEDSFQAQNCQKNEFTLSRAHVLRGKDNFQESLVAAGASDTSFCACTRVQCYLHFSSTGCFNASYTNRHFCPPLVCEGQESLSTVTGLLYDRTLPKRQKKGVPSSRTSELTANASSADVPSKRQKTGRSSKMSIGSAPEHTVLPRAVPRRRDAPGVGGAVGAAASRGSGQGVGGFAGDEEDAEFQKALEQSIADMVATDARASGAAVPFFAPAGDGAAGGGGVDGQKAGRGVGESAEGVGGQGIGGAAGRGGDRSSKLGDFQENELLKMVLARSTANMGATGARAGGDAAPLRVPVGDRAVGGGAAARRGTAREVGEAAGAVGRRAAGQAGGDLDRILRTLENPTVLQLINEDFKSIDTNITVNILQRDTGHSFNDESNNPYLLQHHCKRNDWIWYVFPLTEPPQASSANWCWCNGLHDYKKLFTDRTYSEAVQEIMKNIARYWFELQRNVFDLNKRIQRIPKRKPRIITPKHTRDMLMPNTADWRRIARFLALLLPVPQIDIDRLARMNSRYVFLSNSMGASGSSKEDYANVDVNAEIDQEIEAMVDQGHAWRNTLWRDPEVIASPFARHISQSMFALYELANMQSYVNKHSVWEYTNFDAFYNFQTDRVSQGFGQQANVDANAPLVLYHTLIDRPTTLAQSCVLNRSRGLNGYCNDDALGLMLHSFVRDFVIESSDGHDSYVFVPPDQTRLICRQDNEGRIGKMVVDVHEFAHVFRHAQSWQLWDDEGNPSAPWQFNYEDLFKQRKCVLGLPVNYDNQHFVLWVLTFTGGLVNLHCDVELFDSIGYPGHHEGQDVCLSDGSLSPATYITPEQRQLTLKFIDDWLKIITAKSQSVLENAGGIYQYSLRCKKHQRTNECAIETANHWRWVLQQQVAQHTDDDDLARTRIVLDSGARSLDQPWTRDSLLEFLKGVNPYVSNTIQTHQGPPAPTVRRRLPTGVRR